MMKKFIQKFLLCVVVFIATTTVGLSQQTGVQITINPSPTPYSVMGGGAYCAGQPGVTVSLSLSEVGVNYQLLCNGSNIGLPVAGTGGSLNFGTQINGGVYTVIGNNPSTGCSIQMSNSATVQVNAIPNVTITASGPVTFCGSGTVTLTGFGGPGCTYQWYLNGGIISGANLPVYVANQTGSFKVVAINGNLCSNDHDTMVQVNPLPQAFVVSGSAPTFCQGGTGVTINLNGSQTGVNYQLMLNGLPVGGLVGGTGFALAWSNQAVAGVYTVVATNALTSCTNVQSGSAVVAMDPIPSAAGIINGLTTVCQSPNGVSYSTNVIPNTMLGGYVWSVPNGASIISGQGTTTIQVDFSGASSGDIGVFGQNGCGTGQASLLAVTVNTAPIVGVTANPGVDICVGQSTNLTATGGNAFVWSNGLNTQSISVSAGGTYIVTVTGNNGCTATGNIAITLHALPTPSITVPSQVCTDVTTVTLSGSPSGGTFSGYTVWGNLFYPPIANAGTYPIMYTVTDIWGCDGSTTANITVNPVPTVMFTNIVGSIYVDTPPFDLMANVSPIGGVFSGPGMLGSLFNPATAGPGTHMLTYTYTHPITGCSASQIQYVTVGAVGIDEVSAAVNAVNTYPNPASNNLNITDIDTKQIKSLKIMNFVGEVVYATDINEENMVIDVSTFAAGNYIISFVDANGLSKCKKFMKTE